LLITTVITNGFLVPFGLGIGDGDSAIQPLWAEQLRQGLWSPFPFQQSYGGTFLSSIRAFFIILFEPLLKLFFDSSRANVALHMFFSYVAVPLSVGVATFFTASRYASRVGAILAALVASVSYHSWIYLFGFDYYFALLLIAFIYLFIRANLVNPFFQLSFTNLFVVGFFTGFSLYTFRPALIFATVFFIPFHLINFELKRFFLPQDRLERVLLAVFFILLTIQVQLWLFGSDLGFWSLKRVRLHADSNFRLLIIAALLVWAKSKIRDIKADHLKRAGLVFLGFFVGFAPELIYYFQIGRFVGANWITSSVEQSVQTMFQLPHSFFEMMVGEDHLTVYQGLDRNFPILLFILSLYALFRKTIADKKFLPVFFAGLLAVVAYLRIFMTGPAETRYLFPLFPVLLIAIAVFWDWVRRYKTWPLGLALVLLSVGYQVHQRYYLRQDVIETNRVEKIWKVIEEFRKADVPVVLTDTYNDGNPFTLAAGQKPYFACWYSVWGPPQAVELAKTAPRVGILSKNDMEHKEQVLELYDRKLRLVPYAKVEEYRLFIATPESGV